MEEGKGQTLTIEQQKRLTASGVLSVDGFSLQQINATLQAAAPNSAKGGTKLQILGENLKILSFSKTTGTLSIDGHIHTVKYAQKKQPFIKRMFR